MSTEKELEELFDITHDRVVEIDEKASSGVLEGSPASTSTGPGRPPLFDEPMQQVSFKETTDKVRAIDRRAGELGMRRSEYLRQLVDNDLSCAGLV